jgi:glycosyltransferase involved in cell wall biosynthesis
MIKRLAIVSTHPIQYNVPFFVALAKLPELSVKVFYTYHPRLQGYVDSEFGTEVKWDIPLEEGYDFEYVENTSSQPGTSHRRGIINPTINSDVNKFRPDALLVYGWNYVSHWRVIKHFQGVIPVLFRGDSTNIDQRGFLKSWLRGLYLKRVYRCIDYALYCGSANRAYFEYHGLKHDQLIYVPHAIDNERFQVNKLDLRDSWSIPASAIVILFAGKFIAKKSPDHLLKAFLQLKETTDKHIYMVFVGDGYLKDSLLMMSNESNQVSVLPFVNQGGMPAVYAACDLFCLPSSGPGETWGLAVNEAMAVGKAILVSDKVGCAQDLIKQGENGFVFSHSIEGDLLAKLRLLTSDKDKLAEMGETSRQMIAHWDYQTGVANLVKLLRTLGE